MLNLLACQRPRWLSAIGDGHFGSHGAFCFGLGEATEPPFDGWTPGATKAEWRVSVRALSTCFLSLEEREMVQPSRFLLSNHCFTTNISWHTRLHPWGCQRASWAAKLHAISREGNDEAKKKVTNCCACLRFILKYQPTTSPCPQDQYFRYVSFPAFMMNVLKPYWKVILLQFDLCILKMTRARIHLYFTWNQWQRNFSRCRSK